MKTSAILLLIQLGIVSTAICQQMLRLTEVHGNVQYMDGGIWKPANSKIEVKDNTRIKLDKSGSFIASSEKGSKFFPGSKATEVILRESEMEKGFLAMVSEVWHGLMEDDERQGPASSYRDGKYLMLFPADDEVLLDAKVDFVWSKDANSSYAFFLLENSAAITWMCNNITVKDTAILYDKNTVCPAAKKLLVSKKYNWSIQPSSDESPKSYFVTFTIADSRTKQQLGTAMAELEKNKSSTDAETYEVLKASVYYDHKMYTESYRTLLAAKNRYPGSAVVSDSYYTLISSVSRINQRK